MVFRDNFNVCPRCGARLDRQATHIGHRFLRCSACRGNWVELATFHDMLEMMAPGKRVEFTPRPGNARMFACPACRKPMDKVFHYKLELDLCENHGVWFDGVELEETLLAHALETSDF